jgi:hypothetical protein
MTIPLIPLWLEPGGWRRAASPGSNVQAGPALTGIDIV